jgi:hypothetical protein
MGLDTRPQVEDALLQYLMENYFIPQSVWQVLEGSFGFTQRLDELSERYPREFLEQVVVSGVRMEQTLDYTSFEPGVDGAACDEYRKIYFTLMRTEPEKRGELFERMAALGEFHPLGEALRLRFLADEGSQEAMADFRKLMEKYPHQMILSHHWLAISLQREDWTEVETTVDRILQENPEDLPQLIVIDGGKGQLAFAYEALCELGIIDRLTLVALAERMEEVYRVGDPYPLFIDRNSPALKVLQQIRDEAHRFGITFHRNLRSKAQIESVLKSIKGVGEKTEQRLLLRFGSVARIAAASVEEVAEVVGPALADKILKVLSSDIE